ncbi:hypothetical protein BCR32DRAFT_285032 [Anaeromyces robustus]|uniref:G-protein coupled receptors family 1 profile domain-containing protein n=1 Tax=Anaeromyces robustus TaxID=1754192 RepID=A0A1Y1WQR8_9FUNG|nr:hypothetical protein BCR32DRAFT_285032 [Anaeromyces robustus]|eukprot:ORX75616.1 hypothetical protein BCR32DRAFT_285032 [Anaeromyces robustus]
MINKYQEIAALIIHILSFLGDSFTLYFNNNGNIKFLSVLDMGQHLTKMVRIYLYGFAMEASPTWFCYLHSFLNHFTHNSSLTLSCFVIYNLYTAIVHPILFSKYQKIVCPYFYIFTIIYNALFTLMALYEPLFIHYSIEQINNSHNCSSGYRYRLYQFLLTSATPNLPFTLTAIFCTVIIIHKIKITSRVTLKNQLTKRTNISFNRWLKILLMSITITLFSFLNLYNDIKGGLASEKNIKKEEESLSYIYLFTASSGIILLLLTNSLHQVKRKLKLKNDAYINDYNLQNNNSENNKINYNLGITNDDNLINQFSSKNNTNINNHDIIGIN